MPKPHFTNYHTHTTRCRHATGTEEEYIQTALRCGYSVLGFSDHTPWKYSDPNFVSRIRMYPEQLDDYVASLSALREKYANQLHLHIGLEVEYFPAYLPWLLEQKERLGIEYFIFGCHYDTTDETGIYFGRPQSERDLRRYAEQVTEGLETGLYAYLAHPDICLNHWTAYDKAAETTCREICEAAARQNVPLEYNLAGLTCQNRGDATLGYTTDFFWKIAAEYPVKVIIGCDAHSPEELDVTDLFQSKREFLRGLGLTVLDTIPGLTEINFEQ